MITILTSVVLAQMALPDGYILPSANGVPITPTSIVLPANKSITIGAESISETSSNTLNLNAGAGGVVANQTITPSADNNSNLGGSTLRWGSIIGVLVQASGGTTANKVNVFGVASGVAPHIDAAAGTDTNAGLQLNAQGNHGVGFPTVANASLPTCTAATYSSSQEKAGWRQFDSTNNVDAVCNGTRYVYDFWTTCSMAATASCTQTVPSGTVCECAQQGAPATITPGACNVAATTATCTAAAANTATWNVHAH